MPATIPAIPAVLASLLLSMPAAVLAVPDLENVFQYGSPAFDYGVAVHPSATDPSAFVISGMYEGALTLPGPGGSTWTSTGEAMDGFLAHWTPGRSHLDWNFHMGGTGQQLAMNIATLTTGDYVVTNSAKGPSTANPVLSGPTSFTTTPNNGDIIGNPGDPTNDCLIAKLNNSGQMLWLEQWRGALSDFGKDVLPADDGDFYVLATVRIGITMNFGKPTQLVVPDRGNSFDTMLARYDSNGVVKWARRTGGGVEQIGEFIENDSANGFAMLPDGNIAAGGRAGGTFIANLDAPDETNFPYQNANGFVGVWSPDGELLHMYFVGGSGADEVLDVKACPNGDVLVSGFASSGTQFTLENGATATIASHGGQDAFVARIRVSDGRARWVRSFGSNGFDTIYSAVASTDGAHVYIAAEVAGDVRDEWNLLLQSGAGLRDGFAAALDMDTGAIEQQFPLRGAGEDTFYRVTALPQGRAALTGMVGNGGVLTVGNDTHSFSTTGQSDGYVAVIQANEVASFVPVWMIY